LCALIITRNVTVTSINTANTEIRTELDRRGDEIARLQLKIKEWHDEAERLRQELDLKARAEFDFHKKMDQLVKRLRIEVHELREQRASLEVERNMLSSAKLDMAQEIGRLKRRAEDREEQVKRLLRLIEDKDQTIAEMGPQLKESKRAAALVSRTSAASPIYHCFIPMVPDAHADPCLFFLS
jgi:FtsZ-binding cell division protein ZapB